MTFLSDPMVSHFQQNAGTASTWLITGANLDPQYGGISSVVGRLSSAVSQAGSFRMSLAQFGPDGCQPPSGQRGPVTVFPLADTPWITHRQHWQALSECVRRADGIHIHGIWQKHCAATSFLARRARRPYLISAHGMLDGWALGQKRWKKAAYTALIEARNLRGAACLHALTSAEAADYKQIAPGIPVAVIPNAVEIPDASPAEFLRLFPQLRNRLLILFLGRLHPKKGVDLLVRAWGRVHDRWPDAHLVFAGPDFEDTRSRTEALAAELGLSAHVTFTGMLQGSAKWSALACAHCFVLPSHSEGLSVSVLEAAGSGVPVIITPNCHLPEIVRAGAGWITEPLVDQLAPALETALSASGAARRQMAASGRALVAARYSWPVVGAQMAAVYNWILGGARPDNVEIC